MPTKTGMSKLLSRLWIDLGGRPHEELLKGKTLRAAHPEVCFLIAGPAVDSVTVVEEASDMQVREGTPAVVLRPSAEDLVDIDKACGWYGDTPWFHRVLALDLDLNVVGKMRLNTVDGTNSPCEHGYLARYTNVARAIAKGDFFMVVDRNEQGLPLVYRALADYDRRKDRVLFERTTPGLEQPAKQYMELPPNLLVYISWEDISQARPLGNPLNWDRDAA